MPTTCMWKTESCIYISYKAARLAPSHFLIYQAGEQSIVTWGYKAALRTAVPTHTLSLQLKILFNWSTLNHSLVVKIKTAFPSPPHHPLSSYSLDSYVTPGFALQCPLVPRPLKHKYHSLSTRAAVKKPLSTLGSTKMSPTPVEKALPCTACSP